MLTLLLTLNLIANLQVIATDQNGFGLSSVAPVHILVHISEQNNQTEFIIESTSRAVTKPDQTFKTTIATSNPVFTSESSVSNNVTKSLEFMGNYTTYSTGSSTTNAPLSFTTFSPIPISVCCDNTSSAASLVTNIVEPENFTRISSHAPIPVTICCLNESIATSGESSTNGNHSPTNIFTTTIQPIRTTSEINSTNMTMYVTEVSTPINLINSTATPSPVPISFCCNNESTSSNYTTGTTSKIEFNETATKGSTPSNSTILMTPSSFFPIKTSTVTNFGTSTNGGFSNIQSSTVAPSKYTTESISTKRIQNETGIFTSTDYYSSEILTTNTAYVSTKLPFTSGQNIVEHNCSLKFVTAMEKLSLIEHSPIATPIYVAMVVPDGHLCNVTYSLEGLAKDYFDMNPLSGLIKISKDLDITALLSQQLIDPNGVFELTVKAHSGNGETETKLTMTVVKFPPNSANLGDVHFNRSVYIFNVSENQPNGK